MLQEKSQGQLQSFSSSNSTWQGLTFPDPKKLIEETQTAVVSKQLLRKDSFCPLLASFAKVIISLPTTNTWPECDARSNFLIRSWEAFSTFLSVAQRCVQRSVISSLGKPLMVWLNQKKRVINNGSLKIEFQVCCKF